MGRDNIVITAYGHGKTIDKIAVSSFEFSGHYGQSSPSDAETYCNTINSLELKDDSWVFAKKISENIQYGLASFLPLKLSSVIPKLDNRAIQTVLRKVDISDIAKSLKGEDETIQEKIFSNMSRRAAEMLKEDMRYMGPILLRHHIESQGKIISAIKHLADTGEIYLEGESE